MSRDFFGIVNERIKNIDISCKYTTFSSSNMNVILGIIIVIIFFIVFIFLI